MEQNEAAEHLQVIRTLMERSALYRRTLAPIMLYLGWVGVLAGVGGIAFHIDDCRAFGAWWLAAAVIGVAGAFAIARQQPLEDGEHFWSPPALRVTQAIGPPLSAGLLLSLALIAFPAGHDRWLFVLSNALFYGCAVHAAGFFMPRGTRLFGWLFILVAAIALFVVPEFEVRATARLDHVLMGGLFGLLQLAYGAYLYATQARKGAA